MEKQGLDSLDATTTTTESVASPMAAMVLETPSRLK
jgi:hypothetical protein